MIDIHCHVLFAADDGADDIDMSYEMCVLAAADGIKTIIATPHYIIGEKNERNIRQKVKQLNELLTHKDVDIKIYPGNEVFIDHDLASKLKEGECCSLNDSRYVLVEFPMMEIPKYSSDAFYDMQLKGYTPVIAHPERNKVIQQSPELLYEYISEGCLVQMNSASISGLGGEALAKLCRTLLLNGYVHFVASDAHSCGRRKPYLSHARHIVRDLLGPDKANELFIVNQGKVIRNEAVDIVEPIPIKKQKSLWQMLGFRK